MNRDSNPSQGFLKKGDEKGGSRKIGQNGDKGEKSAHNFLNFILHICSYIYLKNIKKIFKINYFLLAYTGISKKEALYLYILYISPSPKIPIYINNIKNNKNNN